MKIAILPSNQMLNAYAGLPGVTEEKWAVATCQWLVRVLLDLKVDVRIFHIAGTGSKSTDELSQMISQAVAWKPDYMLSVHSDAVGDAKQTGILMLMARESDRKEGQVLGHHIADAVGLPYRGTWVYGNEARKIMFLRTLREKNIAGSLVEVGEHATTAEASWNWNRRREIGEGIGRAIAFHLGITAEPPGQDSEANMPIDKVSDQTAGPYLQKLVEAGIINKPEAHDGDDAVSVNLLWTVVGRLLEQIPKT